MLKKSLLILTASLSLTIANFALALDFIPSGTAVTINDSTNTVAFGTDSIDSYKAFMNDVQEHDTGALKELFSEGHLIAVDNGTSGKTIKFDAWNKVYLVRVKGSDHRVWFIKEIVSQ